MDKTEAEKNYPTRWWGDSKESIKNKKTKIIKKVQKKPLNTKDLEKCLSYSPHFLGAFSSDQILSLRFKQFPISFIVNLQPSWSQGSHWLSIWIDQQNVEIFDSFGFDPNIWARFPRRLFRFLSRFKYSHKLKISPVCQSPNSHYCGLFCIYFICKRPLWTFEKCCAKLKSKNYYRSFRKACTLVLE